MSTYFQVRIEYKDPDVVVLRDMSAAKYPRFLESYPDHALLSKGLKVSKINVEKQFDSEEE